MNASPRRSRSSRERRRLRRASRGVQGTRFERRGMWQNGPALPCARVGRQYRLHVASLSMTEILSRPALLLAPRLPRHRRHRVGLFPARPWSPSTAARRARCRWAEDQRGRRARLRRRARRVIEIDGKRRRSRWASTSSRRPSTGARNSVTLAADTRGHFVTDGQVNGTRSASCRHGRHAGPIPSPTRARLGIDYEKGRAGYSSRRGGVVPVYRVKLDSRLGRRDRGPGRRAWCGEAAA
jgi:hypothetical protein